MKRTTCVVLALLALVWGCERRTEEEAQKQTEPAPKRYTGETRFALPSGEIVTNKYAYDAASLELQPSHYKPLGVRKSADRVGTITVLWPDYGPLEKAFADIQKDLPAGVTVSFQKSSDYGVMKGGTAGAGGAVKAHDHFLADRGMPSSVLFLFTAENDVEALITAEKFLREKVVPNEIGVYLLGWQTFREKEGL